MPVICIFMTQILHKHQTLNKLHAGISRTAMCPESANFRQDVYPQTKVIRDSNPDVHINPDSHLDVRRIAPALSLLSCVLCFFRQVHASNDASLLCHELFSLCSYSTSLLLSWKSAGRSWVYKNVNKSHKSPNFARVIRNPYSGSTGRHNHNTKFQKIGLLCKPDSKQAGLNVLCCFHEVSTLFQQHSAVGLLCL